MSPGKRGQQGTGKPSSGVVYLGRPAWHPLFPGSPEAAAGKGWPGGENRPKRVRVGPRQWLPPHTLSNQQGKSSQCQEQLEISSVIFALWLPERPCVLQKLTLHHQCLLTKARSSGQAGFPVRYPEPSPRALCPTPAVSDWTYVACELMHGAVLGHVVFFVWIILWEGKKRTPSESQKGLPPVALAHPEP